MEKLRTGLQFSSLSDKNDLVPIFKPLSAEKIMTFWPKQSLTSLIVICAALTAFASEDDIAAKPLYRDPVFDGAADPTLIWNPTARRWWMFYTNRRANVPGLSGVTWVHGTPIGIAESADGGAHWKYVGTAKFDLPEEYGGTNVTCWAPDVIRGPDGTFQMFLTIVPGIYENWNHPRFIVQLTSTNLIDWRKPRKLTLASERVIDPSVLKMPDGTWRMWYNNERAGKSINWATSPDLANWTDKGLAFKSRGEGPKSFRWQGKFWVIIDEWKGLGVFRSDDGTHWDKQADNLLAQPGTGDDDQVKGGHPDVVVDGNRAYLFYFTHPGRRAGAPKGSTEQRRSSIQVVELHLKEGRLTCDRNQPTRITMPPSASR
jgi:hypothetical protein